MKHQKTILVLTILLLCVLGAVTAGATAPTATLKAAETVRAGDTLTVTFSVSYTPEGGSDLGLLGLNGDIFYDASKLTLVSTAQLLGSSWSVTFSNTDGNVTFLAMDNTQSSPLTSTVSVFTMTFRVNSTLDVGTELTLRSSAVSGSAGTGLKNLPDASITRSISAPLSTVNTLSGLSVAGATLSPSFSSSNTTYYVTVPYSTSSLVLNTSKTDPKSTVSITGNSLTAGARTTVRVNVTSESGSVRTYTIYATRGQNPDYVKNGDSSLSSLSVTGYVLSPVFSKSVTEYVVWLPYETSSVTLTATASNSKATVSSATGNSSLIAGADNKITVTCTAEDGSKTTYTVTAKRASETGETTPPPVSATPLGGTVSVDGTPSTGETLTLNISSLTPVDAVYTAVWLRDGAEIASGDTYTVTLADAGCSLAVRVDAGEGFSGNVKSAGIAIPTLTFNCEISVTGTAAPGETLTASVTSLTAASGSPELSADMIEIIWKRDGEEVARGNTYNVCNDDIGCIITAEASGIGALTGSVASQGLTATGAKTHPAAADPGATIPINTTTKLLLAVVVISSLLLGAIIGFAVSLYRRN